MRPIGEENVEPSVVVVVEDRYSSQCRVDDRLIVGRTVVEDEIDARGRLAVLETDAAAFGNGDLFARGWGALRRLVESRRPPSL